MKGYYKVHLDNGKTYIVSSDIHNIWEAMETILSKKTIRVEKGLGLIVCSHISYIEATDAWWE